MPDPMTSEEWHKTKAILEKTLELDVAARRDYLDAACAGQPSIRTEVESLLESYDDDSAFLESPAVLDATDLTVAVAPLKFFGCRLGPYELLEQIGEGGMGAVYRAVRADGLYDKQVAIKLIRSGLGSDFFVARFRNERQILAALEHPNIARLLDGGVTEEGLPYVVLEFVAGMPIDEYCARHDLPIADRLKLFRTVCSAVQYAHQNLVVHRDLKPGNILVTEDGIPKLVDFGIAKILGPEAETGRDRTLTVMRVMTPDFASPEQVRGDPITTASDVYSLGVILYLLLTGRRPYRASSTAPHEIVKAICDTEPEKPSTAVSRIENQKKYANVDSLHLPGEQKGANSNRDRLRRALSGDLDNIVLKALRKEPERRYATVEQFSEDIRRHLEHLPVVARKDTAVYRTSKFVLRHKAGVAAALTVALTLIAAFVITIREERLAQRRFNDVRSLANSLIFEVHDSIKDLPGSTPARKLIVDRALLYLHALAQESSNDLALQRELATAYQRVGLVQGHYLQNSLGDTQGSLTSYQSALAIRQRVDAKSRDWNDRLALAESYRLVANQQWALGIYADAAQSIAAAVAISEALNNSRPKDLKILKELGSDYEIAGQIQGGSYGGGGGDSQKADDNYRRAVATDEAMLAISPDDLDVQHAYATDLNHLGGVLIYSAKDFTGGLACYKKELEIDQKLRQRSTETRYARGVAVAYSHIGQTYDKLGDAERSLENYAQGLKVSKELVLSDPRNALFRQGLAIAYANTANELSRMGREVQSLDYIEKSDQIMRALVAEAPENKQQRGTFAAIVAANGSSLMKMGKLDAAFKDFKEARASFESLRKTDSSHKGISVHALSCTKRMGEVESRGGNFKLAAEYFHQVLNQVEPELARQNPDPNAPYLAADSYSGLGDLELYRARRSEEDTAKRQANWIQARSWYFKSLDAWHRIEHPLPVAPSGFDVGNPSKVKKNLDLCEAALARFGRANSKIM